MKVIDVGLSDHCLVQWSLELETTTSVYETISRHAWRSFNTDAFKSELQTHCSVTWASSPLRHTLKMVKHYNDVITNLLNRFAPIQQVTCCRRKSVLWFDNECHQFNQRTRRLERWYLATRRPGDKVAWQATVRKLDRAFRVKSEQFWTAKISKETGRPRQLWSSIDHLLVNSRSATSSCFTADDLMRFFQRKVPDIRVSNEDAPSPTFVPPPGLQLNDFADIVVEKQRFPAYSILVSGCHPIVFASTRQRQSSCGTLSRDAFIK